MTTITVAVSRGLLLTANQRLHWRARAARTAALRTLAYAAWQQAGSPAYDRAEVWVHVAYPDRRTRDVHNLMPTAKALIDGMVSGLPQARRRGGYLLPDDDDKHLAGPYLVADHDHLSPVGVFGFRFSIAEKCGKTDPNESKPTLIDPPETPYFEGG